MNCFFMISNTLVCKFNIVKLVVIVALLFYKWHSLDEVSIKVTEFSMPSHNVTSLVEYFFFIWTNLQGTECHLHKPEGRSVISSIIWVRIILFYFYWKTKYFVWKFRHWLICHIYTNLEGVRHLLQRLGRSFIFLMRMFRAFWALDNSLDRV